MVHLGRHRRQMAPINNNRARADQTTCSADLVRARVAHQGAKAVHLDNQVNNSWVKIQTDSIKQLDSNSRAAISHSRAKMGQVISELNIR